MARVTNDGRVPGQIPCETWQTVSTEGCVIYCVDLNLTNNTVCATIGSEEVIYAMESTTTFSIRMDREIKDKLDEFCKGVGMNANTAFNMFARKVVADQRLPFEVAVQPKPQAGTDWRADMQRRSAKADVDTDNILGSLIHASAPLPPGSEAAALLEKALQTARIAFDGEAERLGLKSMEDVVRLVKETRKEHRRDNTDADNG